MAVYLPQTIELLVQLGANIVIEDSSYLPQTLVKIVEIAKSSGSHITISGSYLPQTLEEIAKIAGNQVTIVVRKDART